MKRKLLIFTNILFASSFGFSQTQLGADIDGEAAANEFGFAVSMPDANTLGVGARDNDEVGTDAGHARIFTWDGSNWVQKGVDIDGEATGDQFGYSISMADSNTVAIGGSQNDATGAGAGHARVFSWDGSAWVQKGLDIDGEAAGDQFGYSVSMPDSNTVAIGAINNDGTGANAGHVRVFSWDGSAWIQKGIDLDGEAAGDNAGRFISMSDSNTIAIGAMNNDGNGAEAGHVRVYEWDGSAWVQKGLDLDGEDAGDNAGIAVAMADSNTLVIGATGNDDAGAGAGHARVYEWDGTTWVQKGADLDGEAAADAFGRVVSMSDPNHLAVGSFFNDGNGNAAGHARIFEWDGTAWVQNGPDIEGEAPGDRFGSVAMGDSNTVAIGGFLNDGNGASSGHVRVFTYLSCSPTTGTDVQSACGSYTWTDGNTYMASNNTATDTLMNAAGCDSIVTLDLTINALPSVTFTVSGVTITADEVGATYQWLDCDNANAPIAGETSQSFTATANGNYAVEVTVNGCSDTSACEAVTTVGIEEHDLIGNIVVYPNPSKGMFNINVELNASSDYNLTVSDLQGRIIYEITSNNSSSNNNHLIDLTDSADGVYTISLQNDEGTMNERIILQH